MHSTSRLGEPKVESARETIEGLNADVAVVPYQERLTADNIDRILADGWDVIVDGADNFPTRYLVNDASVWHRIPVVHGSIFRFEGQMTVFKPFEGPLLPLPSSRSRRRRSLRRAAQRAACSAFFQGSSARFRQARHSSCCSVSAIRSSGGCSCSTRSRRPSWRSTCAAIRTARSVASPRPSPSTSTTWSSVRARPPQAPPRVA